MRFLLIDGSTRAGNTRRLMEFTICNLLEKHEVRVVHDSDCAKCCDGCRSCSITGKCKIGDRLTEVLKEGFDAILLFSPMYFFSLSPICMKVLSRLYSVELEGKVIGLVVCSGSNFRYGGVDIVIEQFKRLDEYCGCITATPYNKVTFDTITEVSNLDRAGIEKLISDMEWLYETDKENR